MFLVILLLLPIFLIPMATNKQKPILGRYRTLSATTKPTGNSKLVAGMKGIIMRKAPKLNVIASPPTLECCDHNCDVILEFILMWFESDLVVL